MTITRFDRTVLLFRVITVAKCCISFCLQAGGNGGWGQTKIGASVKRCVFIRSNQKSCPVITGRAAFLVFQLISAFDPSSSTAPTSRSPTPRRHTLEPDEVRVRGASAAGASTSVLTTSSDSATPRSSRLCLNIGSELARWAFEMSANHVSCLLYR